MTEAQALAALAAAVRSGTRTAVAVVEETFAAIDAVDVTLNSFTARTRERALAAGLELNAGHDLNRANLGDFLRGVRGVQEVSIGHALIGDAIEFGIAETVRLYQRCIRDAHTGSSAG